MYRTLCYAATEALVYDLENYVVAVVAGMIASYSLDQVEDPMNKVVGSEASSLIMDELIKNSEHEVIYLSSSMPSQP